jgi:hypothetical protein
MTIIEDAGEVAAARGLGHEAMTLRPKDGVVRFTGPDGREVVLTFDELAREAEHARAQRQDAQQARPRSPHVLIEYPSPLPGGRR